MSQRVSGYERKSEYVTPGWVTEALLPHLPDYIFRIWEPAAGQGAMVKTLLSRCPDVDVIGTDIRDIDSADFLADAPWAPISCIDAIITNPPYELATEFCERALELMSRGVVAMLLRTDFDHAASRAHLFRDNPTFAKKVVLMKRIVWFVEANGRPKASPSFNHAWYIWDHRHEGPPSIGYGP